MNARELRQKYLAFFESKGHQRHPSGSLVPYDVTGRLDESLLFNGAGMVQFKPYFRGVAQPPSKRLTNVQKCVRTGDIEEIGDLTHLSFFEMMGNFSFGDYFKKEAIALSWEFMTSPEWLGLDPRRLSFTVFEEDDEAFEAWSPFVRSAGFEPEHRIFRLGEDTNYWPAGAFSKGPPGPCGPNSEMFYWVSNEEPPPSGSYSREDWLRDEGNGKWLEIWNDVFIQYEWKGRHKNPDRPTEGYLKEALDPLPFQSVDTGMGLERTATVLGGFSSVYATDVFEPVFEALRSVISPSFEGGGRGVDDADARSGNQSPPTLPISDFPPAGSATTPPSREGLSFPQSWTSGDEPADRAARIIADHARTACFCIADGVLPGNTGRGYVLRRLIRRAVLKGQRVLGIERPFLYRIYEGVAAAVGDHYSELIERKETIVETLRSEEVLFRRTLSVGLQYFFRKLNSRLVESVSVVFREILSLAYRPANCPDIGPVTFTKGGPDLNYTFNHQARELLATMESYETVRADGRQAFEAYDITVRQHLENSSKSDQLAEWNQEGARLINPFVLSGEDAFQLYDTYGFPLEVTQELCQEAGIKVDLDGFEAAMKEAQERSRAAHGMESVYGGVAVRFDFFMESPGQATSATPTPTRFVGYEATDIEAAIVGAVKTGGAPQGSELAAPDTLLAVALDQTPFYAESGGEVSDAGWIRGDGFTLEVLDIAKQEGVYVHLCRPDFEVGPLTQDDLNRKLHNQRVRAEVDAPRRRSITRNHTATHLLHAALRGHLGKHVTQAGSLVSPDHLRFDFTHGKALTDDEVAAIEREVNEKALAAIPVAIHYDVPIDRAKEMGAMALFGEKYGDAVRVVEVPGYSLELCGGCHVRNTAEIGLFKILHEASAASGVRRIEAVTGERAYTWARDTESRLERAAAKLKANPNDLESAVERLQEQLREERRRLERMRSQAASGGSETVEAVGPVEWATQVLEEGDVKEATLMADRLTEGKPSRVAFVALAADGKVQLVAKAGPEAVAKGAHAGNLVREAAKVVGGGGGGRPDFATAGGRDPSKVQEAVQSAMETLKSQVGG